MQSDIVSGLFSEGYCEYVFWIQNSIEKEWPFTITFFFCEAWKTKASYAFRFTT